jgi:hypothetical protein
VVKLHFNLGQLNANPADRPTISQGVNPLAAATVQNVKEAAAHITSGTAATCRRVEASCNKQQPVDISSCQHPITHEAQLPRKQQLLLLVHPLPDFAQQLLIVLFLCLQSLIK